MLGDIDFRILNDNFQPQKKRPAKASLFKILFKNQLDNFVCSEMKFTFDFSIFV